MRMPEAIPISTRELIWNLPELLEGDEPVLKRPAVREYLRTDPAARAALLAVAEMANALTGASEWMHRMPTVLPRVLSRPVQVAKRYFAAELVDVLFEVAVDLVSEKARQSGVHCHRAEVRWSPNRPRQVDRAATQLAEAMGSGAHEANAAIRTCAIEKTARAALEACERLLPGLDGNSYLRLFDEELDTQNTSSAKWLTLARRARYSETRGGALVRAAVANARVREFAAAYELDHAAILVSPQLLTAHYHLAIHAALAGLRTQSRAAICEWQVVVGTRPDFAQVFAAGIRSDADLWSRSRSRSVLQEAVRENSLPATILAAISEVIA